MTSTISLWVPSAIIAVGSIPLMLNLVPPNRVYGFRTPRTLANRDLWFRANRFAGCAFFIASAASAGVFAVHPGYASGRSLAGLAVFLTPLGAALVASVAYARRR
jgi:uncharacterized membrane protein